MKILTQTLGETIVVIQIRRNYSLKQLSEIWNIPTTTLSSKIRSNKFNASERINIINWIKENGYDL